MGLKFCLLIKGTKIVVHWWFGYRLRPVRPEGEGDDEALGKGYVSSVNVFLQSSHPELAIRVVIKRISGNKVRVLQERWQKDVLKQRPDWLVIMIGIKDVLASIWPACYERTTCLHRRLWNDFRSARSRNKIAGTGSCFNDTLLFIKQSGRSDAGEDGPVLASCEDNCGKLQLPFGW